MTPAEASFLDAARVARLATADAAGRPHLVPVCFARSDARIYITVDEKPKRGTDLKRLRNIRENPHVALTVDRYDDADWSLLGWVMLRGTAEILTAGEEHDQAQDRLSAKHAQLRNMELASLPVIAIEVEKVASWGNLAPAP
jgi:PPOX class probable F420-dependent enzyme